MYNASLAEQEWLEEKIKELAEQSFGPQPYSEAVEIIENQVIFSIRKSGGS
ncbi:hypothetical protein DPMN_024225 [Dreissena polymorpha]|uniref:Uncharacterized protein n=1 Tax=Dreissena polymorpha TaxID=45954 RepID=A0A9D4RAM1_DREPO|nr:hypothetical protein DPMN_024225 [Dreissena polymorpha]